VMNSELLVGVVQEEVVGNSSDNGQRGYQVDLAALQRRHQKPEQLER